MSSYNDQQSAKLRLQFPAFFFPLWPLNISAYLTPYRVIMCVCACVLASVVTSCESTEFLDKWTGSSAYNGVFTLLNTSHSGRPVYRHERHRSLYLYYSHHQRAVNCSSQTGGAWVVGDGVGQSASSMSMFAVDDAVDPMLISADSTWRVYDRTSDQFAPDSRLTLVCYVAQR